MGVEKLHQIRTALSAKMLDFVWTILSGATNMSNVIVTGENRRNNSIGLSYAHITHPSSRVYLDVDFSY